jgi:hypothetical protein
MEPRALRRNEDYRLFKSALLRTLHFVHQSLPSLVKSVVLTDRHFHTQAWIVLGSGVVMFAYPLILSLVLFAIRSSSNNPDKKNSDLSSVVAVFSASTILAAVTTVYSATQVNCMITGNCKRAAWGSAITFAVLCMVYMGYVTYVLVWSAQTQIVVPSVTDLAVAAVNKSV